MGQSLSLNKLEKYFFFFLSAILVLGLVMVYSSSYLYSKELFNVPAHYFWRQSLHILAAMAFAFCLSRVKLDIWIRVGPIIHLFVICLLALTFLTPLGVEAKGARRWIKFGSIGLQPGEFIKYTYILAGCHFLVRWQKLSRLGIFIQGSLLLLPLILLLQQPDYGSFFICLVIMAFVANFGQIKRKWYYSGVAISLGMGAILLFMKAYRIQRLMSFLDPWKNPKSTGFQIIQSYLAFAHGKIFGQGLGNSTEKLFYLPEAHNDFIFSVLGEEMGFLGVTLLVLLFLGLIYTGLKICLKMSSRLHATVMVALIFTIGLQTFLNMGVVLGLLPTKGLNLPFVSYGGSSMMANFLAIGLILSGIRSHKVKERKVRPKSSTLAFPSEGTIYDPSGAVGS